MFGALCVMFFKVCNITFVQIKCSYFINDQILIILKLWVLSNLNRWWNIKVIRRFLFMYEFFFLRKKKTKDCLKWWQCLCDSLKVSYITIDNAFKMIFSDKSSDLIFETIPCIYDFFHNLHILEFISFKN